MEKLLLSCLMLLGMAGSLQAKTVNVNLTFECAFYCNAAWNSESRIFSWGTYPQDSWMDKGWTFTSVKNLSGDISDVQKLVFKLEDWTNTVDNKLTIYFKGNVGNTQTMDHVTSAVLTPNAEGIAEVDLTTLDWTNDKDASETIDKTDLADVTIYGGARTDEEQNGSVKITEAYMMVKEFDTSKNHALLFNNGTAGANPWDHQAQYTLPAPLEANKTYVFEAVINAVNGGETRLVPFGGDGSAQYLESKGLWANEFTRYKVEFTASSNHAKLEIDLGPCGGEVYFDNVSLVEKGGTTNLISNGNFETPGTEGWSTVNNTMKLVEKELGEIQEPGVQVSVGEAGWKTFRTGINMQISDANVKAYVAKYVAEGNYVKLTEVTEVPSWQPVLIKAPQGNYLLKSPASVEGFPYGENDLKANGNTALPGDGTLYGLAKKNGVVGFYKISDKVPAWRIFLEIPAAEGREFIGFAADATTIKAIENLKQSGLIYNLGGQQVKSAQKGIFIMNGKKFVK